MSQTDEKKVDLKSWRPDPDLMEEGEVLLAVFEDDADASKWVEEHAPNGDYEGAAHDGTRVKVTDVDFYVACQGTDAAGVEADLTMVTGYPLEDAS